MRCLKTYRTRWKPCPSAGWHPWAWKARFNMPTAITGPRRDRFNWKCPDAGLERRPGDHRVPAGDHSRAPLAIGEELCVSRRSFSLSTPRVPGRSSIHARRSSTETLRARGGVGRRSSRPATASCASRRTASGVDDGSCGHAHLRPRLPGRARALQRGRPRAGAHARARPARSASSPTPLTPPSSFVLGDHALNLDRQRVLAVFPRRVLQPRARGQR